MQLPNFIEYLNSLKKLNKKPITYYFDKRLTVFLDAEPRVLNLD